MARQRAPDEPEDDVPAWVMTFSDVITLLMTFFILLLTFATNQAETFDRMKVAMFGGGGSRGFAGSVSGMDKDAILLRERSRAGRLSPNGSEMPPIHSDPALSTLDKGIKELKDSEQRTLENEYRLKLPLGTLFTDERPNKDATGYLASLARQIRRRKMSLSVYVNDEASLERTLNLWRFFTDGLGVSPAALAVGISPQLVEPDQVLLVIVDQGAVHGSQD